jgi:ATP-dependent DNA helicase PIF1
MDDLQKKSFSLVQEGHNLFITGSAGTGKSFTINSIYSQLRDEKIIGITAMTGCAAILLNSKARTLHSWAGIGLGKEDVDFLLAKIRRNKKAFQRWKTTDILIIDEVSMLSCQLFEKLNVLGQKIRHDRSFFGGIQIVLVGDFFQLPSIDDDIFLFESDIFKKNIIEMIELKTIYRQKNDLQWYNLLQKVRFGELGVEEQKILQSRICELKNPICTLFPTNKRVDFMNEKELLSLNMPIKEFKVEICNAESSSDDDIASLKNQFSVPDVIKVAIGSHVILTRNIDLENGLVNGSQGIVKSFSCNGHPIIKFIRIKHAIEIMPIEFSNEDESNISFKQYPLKLAWALSIHKVQGHNLDSAMMDLGSNIFEYGQAYVALSRIKTLDGVFLSRFDPSKIKVSPKVIDFYKKI